MNAPAKTLLIKNIDLLVTMDATRQEIKNAALFCRGGVIAYCGSLDQLPPEMQAADETLNLAGHLVMPGLINTHHHMFQSLTRALPAAQNGELFSWLKALYPLWAGLTPEMIYVSTQMAMSELMLSGCTTSSDHLYIYPNGCRLDDSIEAAIVMGMRFHATRGAMSVGESKGGLPPDRVVEAEDVILQDARRLIETWHNAQRHAMTRIAVAPCSPFSVSRDLMKEAASLARAYKVGLHTHLAENIHDIAYSQEKFGCTPAQYAEDLGWLGEDVWHAHCVQLDTAGIALFAQSHTGVAHCPCSNMRLASGIAPIAKMLDAGINVGLGVDGSASNDKGHMLGEARQAMLLQRVGFGQAALTARQALELATRGGARVLQRDDIGHLAVGMSADFIAFQLNDAELAGSLHDPVAALIFCTPSRVHWSVINGVPVIRQGELVTIELAPLVKRHNEFAKTLARSAH